ncbi:MFS multidrug transporter [Niveomyces insectorum RCEF 264]|uniref:EKC/KEOPS complex subunit BUD32 n=1 Tax=Niveomyces insectorum RCEF 264 TaxID=1081102 RepID=A0A167XY48_9HYPO|nr:MFS multidrug transporter [Niveomyces insectorum RCEF 264]
MAFGVGAEVAALGTTLFVLGFVAGPVLWAPSSELQGRKWPIALGILGGGIFAVGSAAAKDIQTLIICRFFAGVCGASPFAVGPGVLADLFSDTYRGAAITVYSLTVFGGPFLAPVVSGFLVAASPNGGTLSRWRWTLYIPAMFGFVNGAAAVVWLPETYAPCLLVNKAERLRRQTGNWGIHAPHERLEIGVRALVDKYFTRPLRLLCTEPIVFLVSLYMSIVYGLVYALLEAYPYVFQHTYGMGTGVSCLPFLALFVGVVLASSLNMWNQAANARLLAAHNNVLVPEWALRPTLLGAPVLPIGIFWFGWTAFTPVVPWPVPTVAGILVGFGTVSVYLPCFCFLVDAYLPLAASTVAANVILRSTIAASFPLFAKQMFENMGIQWACTLLGCLSVVLIPIPFAFRVYGPENRRFSVCIFDIDRTTTVCPSLWVPLMESIPDVDVFETPIDPSDPKAGTRTLRILKGDVLKRSWAAVGRGRNGFVELTPCGTRVTKCLRPDRDSYSQRQSLRSLIRECDVYCHLPPHRRILAFYGFTVGPVGDDPSKTRKTPTASITLQYMKNGDLRKYLANHPDQSMQQRMMWCAQATEGLMHLHRYKVIHSDMRPDNMLVADDLTLRLIDFGGSAIDGEPSLVAEATRYFLPRDDWATTQDTDRFALGSSFYHIMTGRDPYHDLARDLVDTEFAKKAYPSDVHDLLIGAVIVKCWECKYANTRDVWTDLYNLRDRVPPC